MTPRATLRLQFHKGFTFADAERHVDYFARLGISHVYSSPITTARPGSMHGYDVIDPTRVSPELGGEDALRRLVAALRRAELGLIVDIVPNHMAVGDANAWWFDVLKHGRESRYAPYFDIDWNAEDTALHGKVLLPALGKPLREAIADGEITFADNEIRYFQYRFPLRLDGNSAEPLDALLSHQHYRLAWWRVANDEINWRRFFDINELAGLRMEHEPAFDDVHALIFRLYAEGMVDGVRVDHVDGLSDPSAYCRKLRARLEALTAKRPAAAPGSRPYIVVEKILLRDETLPTTWDTDGTSGYDFMNEVGAVQHDAAGETPLNALWEDISGRSADFEVEEQAARREIIARSFSAHLEACAAGFHRVARAERAEISRAAIRRALIELLAHFPVYRTYATAGERPISDKPFLAAAMAGAKMTCLSSDRIVIDRLQAWIAERSPTPGVAELQDRAATRFQQLSAPVAAKAVEDTAFYRYGRLLSRNDVGFDVRRFSDSTADFHAHALRRHKSFPHAMLATATHDHKRGEDVRARLAVLSEYAEEWASTLPDWIARCRTLAGSDPPSPADIAMLLQTIVGAWPLDLTVDDDRGRRAFADRVAQWQEKALREAKLATDWTVPNERYEKAARELTMSLVAGADAALLRDIVGFAQRISAAGAVNGLAQTLLKLTAPGVPDIYQGTEFWDFSLVDPDNRRPVEFAARTVAFDDAPLVEPTPWRDGRMKQTLIARTLALRAQRRQLFAEGNYEPIDVHGALADRVVAFARRLGDECIIAVVPRAASRLLRDDGILFRASSWKDTSLALPHTGELVNVFTEARLPRETAYIPVNSLFSKLPVAVLASLHRT